MLEMKPNNGKTSSDLEGARRATGESLPEKTSVPDPQVTDQPKRRRFTAKYKLSILQKADQCLNSGEIGTLLRKEGLYSSHLSNWRKLRSEGILQGLSTHQRGPKTNPNAAQARENIALQKQIAKLKNELSKAHTIIDVQKKLSTLLAMTKDNESTS